MDIVVSRIIDAAVEEAWKAWSRSEFLMRWWGPEGFTCPAAKMDFREGGVSLVCMRAPKELGGRDMYNTWSYKKILPMERIEFVMDFAGPDGIRIDPASIGLPAELARGVKHQVRFENQGPKTRITVTEFDYQSEQVMEMSKSGLEQCLDKMEKIYSAG